MVVRGVKSGMDFSLYFSYSHAGVVYVTALPRREVETKRLSFQDTLSHAIHDTGLPLTDVQIEPVVQIVCGAIHADGDIFGDAQLGQSSIEVTSIEPEMNALFCDVSDAFEVDSDLQTVVHDISVVEFAIAEVEQLFFSESQ